MIDSEERAVETIKVRQARRSSATIEAISKATGWSTKTVSLALRDEPGVASATAKMIREAADKLGYHRRQKLAVHIGAVTPRTNHPFYAHLLEAMEDYATRHGYVLTHRVTGGNASDELNAIDSLDRRRVEGLILVSPRAPAVQIASRARRERPVVVVNAKLDPLPPGFASVSVDSEQGTHRAISYLLEQGHRRIAYLGGPLDSQSAQTRRRAYEAMLSSSGFLDPRFIVEMEQPVPADCKWGHDACSRVLELEPPLPTAIFAYSDLVAIGAMRRIFDDPRALKVPDDISVVGFDDIEVARFTVPRLTTVEVPRQTLATEAMLMLIHMIERGPIDAADAVKNLPAYLRPRESTSRRQ